MKLDPTEPRQLLEKKPKEKNKDRNSKFVPEGKMRRKQINK